MGDLGDLLELIHDAGSRLGGFGATLEIHTHLGRQHAAIAGHLRAGGHDPDLGERPGDETTVQTLRIDRDLAGDRLREAYAIGLTGVRVGRRWLTVDPHQGAVHNEGAERHGTGIGASAALVADPAALLGALRLEPLGSGAVAGRATRRARGRPRVAAGDAAPGMHRLSAYAADEVLVDLDAEHGLVLRQEHRRQGEWFECAQVRDLVLDPRFAPGTFSLDPPSGVRLRRVDEVIAEG